MITIDTTAAEAPYEQVKTQITAQAASGELAAGTRLPPVRQLAEQLGLAPNTVAKAYRDLEQAGVIVSVGNVMSFPWVRERVQAGKLSVHGWYYDLRSSELHAFNPVDATFHRLYGHDGVEMPSVVANADDATAESDRRLTRFVEAQRQRLIVAKAPIG